jgi:hypothetical protein
MFTLKSVRRSENNIKVMFGKRDVNCDEVDLEINTVLKIQNCDLAYCFVLAFKKRVPKNISRPKKERATGDWGELHSGSFINYTPINNIRAIKSRR